MTQEEMLRILKFIGAARTLSELRTSLSTTDPRWNIISFAMRRHIEGRLITVTSLASAAGVPYATAMRRIDDLLDEGFLLKRPRTKSGKSFSLHPTRKLIREFESFATQLKVMVGTTFGFTTGDGALENFYFGGYYMASRILPFPNAMRSSIGPDREIRILSPIDPTFKTLSQFSSNLDTLCGAQIKIINLPLDELHLEIMNNSKKPESWYDLMAFDLPWIGQLAEERVIQPLCDIISDEQYSSSDFHTAAWKGSAWRGKQYGLPIQPTAELLFCRSDLFANAGLSIPKTTDDLLFAARVLHRSGFNLSGIVMNFRRGTPVAHTFIQTLADFGQPVLNLRRLNEEFDVERIERENYRPMIDTEAGRQTANYLLELLKFAHPESMQCNWDRRIRIFSEGQAAMCYGWSIRAASFELNDVSPAYNNVAFAPHPSGSGHRPLAPIGGFSLAMPSGLHETRRKSAWKVMEYLTRPELMKWYVQNGNLTSPRFSTSADPEVQSKSKMISEVDGMERRGELQIWPRPPIPEFSDMLAILGDEIHEMLQGELKVDAALARAQNRVDSLMRANGRY
jgi:multiple sugar transport system substrate-binding protein